MEAEVDNQPKRKWTGRTRGGVFGNWVFQVLIRFFGLMPAYALLIFVAAYFVFFAPKALKASHGYRSRIGYNSPGWFTRNWAAYKHFFSYGITLLDRSAVLMGFTERFTIDIDGEEKLFQALKQGKGLILTGVHCGNWEISAQALAGTDVVVNILIYQGEVEKIKRMFSRFHTERKVNFIGISGDDGGILECMSALSRGEVVAVLGDRTLNPNEKNTATIPFLGSPARFPIGPHLLAGLTGTPIIQVFAMRTSLYHYRFNIFPPDQYTLKKRAERQNKLVAQTKLLFDRTETFLREYPLQWYNFYEVWDEE